MDQTKLKTWVEQIVKHGPTRVVINKDGEATTPERARRDYHVKPDVVYIRNDGWSLGAPFELVDVAEKTWRGEWVAFMRRTGSEPSGWLWWPRDECPECGGKVYKVDKPDPYPECAKMAAVQDKSQAIGAFLDWLSEKGIVLASYYEEAELSPYRTNIEQLLAEYFEIDLDKVDKEKQAMIEELRRENA